MSLLNVVPRKPTTCSIRAQSWQLGLPQTKADCLQTFTLPDKMTYHVEEINATAPPATSHHQAHTVGGGSLTLLARGRPVDDDDIIYGQRN